MRQDFGTQFTIERQIYLCHKFACNDQAWNAYQNLLLKLLTMQVGEVFKP